MDITILKAKFEAEPNIPKWVVEETCAALELASARAKESERKDVKIKECMAMIEKLQFDLACLRRIRFCAKSESLSHEQLDMFSEELGLDIAEVEAVVETLTDKPTESKHHKKKRVIAGRQPLPDHLQRVEILHEVSCKCGKCGSENLKKIGEDITEKLNVKPAEFFVEKHIYPKSACLDCETVVAEAVPPAIIDGGIACTPLLAWVVVSKYVDHLPLYRLERMAERDGVSLPRSNLAAWVGKVGVALKPLAARLVEMLLQRDVLLVDETTASELAPKTGKTKRCYLWGYRTNDLDRGPPPIVAFDYQPGRGGWHAVNFLKEWRGHLMVDDYSGYKQVIRQGVKELACMAHARRKFFDVHAATQSPVAAKALGFIAGLYEIESLGKNLDVRARKKLRGEESIPILLAFHQWLTNAAKTVAAGSAIAKAIKYSLRRWEALKLYAETGNLPIDNNPIENAFRPFAIGRKNWMFVGSRQAGERAATILTLLATAKLNGLDPMAWLKDTLEKLPSWTDKRIDELLPLRKST
jgi:transposase